MFKQPLTETVKHLLIVNVLIFLIYQVALKLNNVQLFEILMTFPIYNPLKDEFKSWQVITNMFTHFAPMHILANMISLYFIGPTVEMILKQKKFIILYFAAGIMGTILQIVFNWVFFSFEDNIPLLGASGAISGIFGVMACYYPESKIVIFPIFIPIKIKYAFLIFAIFSAIAPFAGLMNGFGHYAHLGGAITGYLIASYWKKNQFRVN